jgi:integrase
MPADSRAIRREHVEAFVADQVPRWRPNTARNRYVALKRFLDRLANEGLIEGSPMVRMRPPRVAEEPVPVLREEAVRALLRACEGKTFADRRDAALIRLLLDSGARRSEIAGLTVDAVDLRDKTATVLGKGAGRGPSPSAPEPRSRSIASFVKAGSTATPNDPSCGSVEGAGAPPTASPTSFSDAA